MVDSKDSISVMMMKKALEFYTVMMKKFHKLSSIVELHCRHFHLVFTGCFKLVCEPPFKNSAVVGLENRLLAVFIFKSRVYILCSNRLHLQ